MTVHDQLRSLLSSVRRRWRAEVSLRAVGRGSALAAGPLLAGAGLAALFAPGRSSARGSGTDHKPGGAGRRRRDRVAGWPHPRRPSRRALCRGARRRAWRRPPVRRCRGECGVGSRPAGRRRAGGSRADAVPGPGRRIRGPSPRGHWRGRYRDAAGPAARWSRGAGRCRHAGRRRLSPGRCWRGRRKRPGLPLCPSPFTSRFCPAMPACRRGSR